MKDEIKEILTISGRYITNDEKGLILDYITKLQTIEQQYSAVLSENAELQQENERLKEDIERLADRFHQMRKNKDEQFDVLFAKYNALLEQISLNYKLSPTKIILENANGFNEILLKKNKDYKSRCEKAVELLDKLWSFPDGNFEIATDDRDDSYCISGNEFFDKLEETLQGSDKE